MLQPKLVSGQRAVATYESPLPEPALGGYQRGFIQGPLREGAGDLSL